MTQEVKERELKNIAVGAVFLSPLFALYFLTAATAKNVWLFGEQIHIGCWFRDYFGVPCPVCGMTRSVILTVHGELATAFQMHIGGPLLILGVIFFGSAMIYGYFRRTAPGPNANSFEKNIFLTTTYYFAAATIVSAAFWLCRILGYASYI